MTQETKVVVITGASQGLGAALLKGYRAAGWKVVANSRTIKPSADPDVATVAGDIADPAVAERIVATAIEKFGRIDTLINNAGIFTAKPFTAFTAEDWAANTGTNLAGFFFVTQAAIRRMEPQGSGHVVQISTSLVEQPIKGVPSVLASLTKGGLNAATTSLAIEYADKGIRVNAVALGIIKTSLHPPETHAGLATLHPLGRLGEVEEAVHGVLYLENAAFVTGEILHVDGGQSAGHW
ncbi:MAG: SDR family oxidoreductase [Alphaproteobacteria bacterium]|nr:SDR family oxidoreductase [Alphaproteobacteria bacterium]MBU1515165.1 SDR family oxidoreductase [Alphaproteobacteria bacterium]MBU2092295.1 SDR family oxidoreductase [Alphaproteobacteria bacterium]MBU2152889.1 SDR family oxidoreductase [Alphaproteobacteria bacterium]MBU2305720.1 SDR family oxidoreductase [Alphaproteobacteria bacterium]